LKTILLILVLVIGGCASMKPMRGSEGQHLEGEKKPEVTISALYDNDLSQNRYHVINVYFRNNEFNWIRIKKVQIMEVPGAENFHVIQDEDLNTWKKSMLLDYDLKSEAAKKEKKPAPSSELKKRLNSLNQENSLYAQLSLPGQLQTERWVLIQTPEKDQIQDIVLEVTFIDSSVAKYKLHVEGKSL
jgi:hypothetical protein